MLGSPVLKHLNTLKYNQNQRIQQDCLQTVGLTQPTIYRLAPRDSYTIFISVFRLPL